MLHKSYEVNPNVLKRAKDGSVSKLDFFLRRCKFFRFDAHLSPTRRRGIVANTYEDGGITSLITI